MVINLKDPNKDVEETKAKEMKDILLKAILHHKVERLCFDLFTEAAEGNASDLMTMLDVFASMVVDLVARDGDENIEGAVKIHAEHVLQGVKLMRGVKSKEKDNDKPVN